MEEAVVKILLSIVLFMLGVVAVGIFLLIIKLLLLFFPEINLFGITLSRSAYSAYSAYYVY